MSQIDCYQEFEFDLPDALLGQVISLFDSMDIGVLEDTVVQAVDDAQGLYLLYVDKQLMYVGKTDSDAGLKARLLRHARKIQARKNLEQASVGFKAVRIFVFTAMDLEGLLIKYYHQRGVGLPWNNSGFGSNDPGRQRDHTKLKDGHFDKQHPIDLDIGVDFAVSRISVAEVLQSLKDQLSYTVRFETQKNSRAPHHDLIITYVELGMAPYTVKDVLSKVSKALGADWQVTALPGHVIVYKENVKYVEGEIVR